MLLWGPRGFEAARLTRLVEACLVDVRAAARAPDRVDIIPAALKVQVFAQPAHHVAVYVDAISHRAHAHNFAEGDVAMRRVIRRHR